MDEFSEMVAGRLFAVSIARQEIDECNIFRVLELLKGWSEPSRSRALRQKVSFIVDGFNDDNRELFEIEEIRAWFLQLDKAWPYCFFYCDPEFAINLQLFALAQCPNRVVGKASDLLGGVSPSYVPGLFVQFTDSQKLEEFLMNHFGAMNYLCAQLGDEEEVVEQMSTNILAAFGLNS